MPHRRSALFLARLSAAMWLFTGCKSPASGGGKGSKALAGAERAQASVSWQGAIDVAAGRAHAGEWRMNDSDFDYVDDPTLAMAEDGSVGVAWCDNHRKDVFFQLYDPRGRPRLPAPVNVSLSPTVFSWLPRVVLTGEQVFVLWQEIVFSGGSHGGEIYFSRSRDAGRSFSAAINLSRSLGGDGKGRLDAQRWDNGSLDLFRSADGKLLAAWTEYDGALWFSQSLDEGQSFAAPLLVAGSKEQPTRGPVLAATRESIYLAWTLGEEPSANLRLAVSRDQGRTFGEPRVILASQSPGDAPKIAVDARGVLHLVYGESARGAARVLYARSKHDYVFDAPQTLSARSGSQSASFPSLSLAANGHVYVVWQHHPSPREGARGLGFAWSRDGGNQFTAPALVPGTTDAALGVNGSRQGKLMRVLAANDSGGLAVVNSSFREGAGSRIRLSLGHAR